MSPPNSANFFTQQNTDAIQIWMNKRHIIVAGNDIAQCGETFFDTL
jgi:hypothetical protein